MDEPNWLLWATELQAIAQTGLTFSSDRYDIERYQRLRAIAVAMLASGSGAPVERISALFEQDLGYPTPKVDVRGAVFRDERILLVREISDGRWTLPGGWATSINPRGNASSARSRRSQASRRGPSSSPRSGTAACRATSPAIPTLYISCSSSVS